MRRVFVALLAVGILAVGAAPTGRAQERIVVGAPVALPAEVLEVRAVAAEGDRYAVVSSSRFRETWSLMRTSGSSTTHTELSGPETGIIRTEVAVGSGGAAVAWTGDGSLTVALVRGDGRAGPVVSPADGQDRVVEAEVVPFGDRFLVSWVEAVSGRLDRLRVVSRTYGVDGSAGPVRSLSEVVDGDSVGALRASWHAGRGEALVVWFAGPPGLEVPIRGRRVVSETELGPTRVRSDAGLPAFPAGGAWDIRAQLTVHGPTEWLLEARTYDCALPCEATASELTFLTFRDSFGVPFDGGFGNRPHWERSRIAGSAAGPTLLVEQPGLRSSGPAEVWELPWQTIGWVDQQVDVPLPDGTQTFEVHAHAGETRVLAQVPGSAAEITDLDVVGFVPTPLPAPLEPSPGTPGPAPAYPDTGSGYWLVDEAGDVHGFGGASDLGGVPATTLAGAEIVDIEATRSGFGYWILLADQRVVSHGDARVLHDGSALLAGERAAAMMAHPTADGYWIATDRGRVLAYGEARNLGDLGAIRLNGPVLDAVATPSGEGYWLVAADGGVFAFGDAEFHGSMGSIPLNLPVVGMAPTSSGEGYWLVAADGGIFAFGDAEFHGSMGGVLLVRPVNGMVATGDGYLLVASDGGVFAFGDAEFRGSIGGVPRDDPIVALAPLAG